MRRRRFVFAAFLFMATFFCVILILVLQESVRDAFRHMGRPGHVEYCEHQVSQEIRVRLAFTPYSTWQEIDPNNWKDAPLAFDFMPHFVIVIPTVKYEVTRDGGVTWEQFWHFDNFRNEYPWCDAFDSLDTSTFWFWIRSWIAVTHDSGESWLIQNGHEEWDTGGNMTIDYVEFDTQNQGRIVFFNWQNAPDPTLLTDDGGRTWHPDPLWIAPYASQNP